MLQLSVLLCPRYSSHLLKWIDSGLCVCVLFQPAEYFRVAQVDASSLWSRVLTSPAFTKPVRWCKRCRNFHLFCFPGVSPARFPALQQAGGGGSSPSAAPTYVWFLLLTPVRFIRPKQEVERRAAQLHSGNNPTGNNPQVTTHR